MPIANRPQSSYNLYIIFNFPKGITMTLEEFREKATDKHWTPGWDHIDSCLYAYYGNIEPTQFGYGRPAAIGGSSYLFSTNIYKNTLSTKPYYHLIGFGLSELFANEKAFGGEHSGWGYEFTIKLYEENQEDCMYIADIFNTLAKYTIVKKVIFRPNTFITLKNSINPNKPDSKITGFIFVNDTEIKSTSTIYGQLDFLQLVGITDNEYNQLNKNPAKVATLISNMKKDNPNLVIDTNRTIEYL